jgi:hypothetical protein
VLFGEPTRRFVELRVLYRAGDLRAHLLRQGEVRSV